MIARIAAPIALFAGLTGCGVLQVDAPDELPEYEPGLDVPNHDWSGEERIEIEGYDGDAMEVGISPDGELLLFNDRGPDKDLHWSTRVDDRTYRYRGTVENTVSPMVDGTPSFDGRGNVYYTSLEAYPGSAETIYRAAFRDGRAIDPVPVEGDIYVRGRNGPGRLWVSLDPDVTDDGTMMVYSEGRFDPTEPLPYPFNVRGAERVGERFVRTDESAFSNVNTAMLEYAPAISADGLELFFTRIARVGGRPKMIGIYTARRRSRDEPFGRPEKIVAITGDVEGPVLSGDERQLYYHRLDGGRFRVYRVTR